MKTRNKRDRIFGLRWVNAIIVDIIVIIISIVYGVFCSVESENLSKESVTDYEEAVYDGYRTEIKSQVEACISLLQYYYDETQAGEYTEEEAKNLAKESIRVLRYREDQSGYMWIDDTDYNLIMHPILSEQEGSNRKELEDKNGVLIIQEIVKVCEQGGGYNSFWFTKSDGTTVAEKLAYSEEFEPWGWIVSTGNYLDDMQAAVSTTENVLADSLDRTLKTIAVMTVVVILIAGWGASLFGKRISDPIKELGESLDMLAKGDLRFTVNEKLLHRRDEVGSIARRVKIVQESLRSAVSEINHLARKLGNDSESFSENFSKASDNIRSISKAVEEIANGAMHQAEDTEVVNQKAKELEGVISYEEDVTKTLEKAVASLLRYSDEAIASMNELSEISDRTSEAIAFVSEQTVRTNQSALDIQNAVKIITDIADQTSLLSLNASIEAAHASEGGRSFAVVAEEIRNLADESSSSASVITDAVNELIANAKDSVKKMTDVSGNVNIQMKRLQDTIDIFEHLYEVILSVEDESKNLGAKTEQLHVLKETVADSIVSLASVTQQSAAGSEETSANMNALSESIENSNNNLNELVDLNRRLTKLMDKFII